MLKQNEIKPIIIGMLLIFSSLAILIFVSEEVSAQSWTVSAGGGDFNTISEAINDPRVTNGDVIVVSPGTYQDNVNVNKKLTITSQDPINTIIQQSNDSLPVFDINIDSVTIMNLTIQGNVGDNPPACGVQSDVTAREHFDILLKNLDISSFETGIKILRTNPSYSYPTTHDIESCIIHDNSNGIYISADPSPGMGQGYCTHIEDSIIRSNNDYYSGYESYGIEIHGDKNTIKNSLIHGHQKTEYERGIGIYLYNADDNEIYSTGNGGYPYCKIYDNDMGIKMINSNNNYIYNDVSIYSNGGFSESRDYMYLYNCDYNEFYDLSIHNNSMIFDIDNSDYNIIDECEIKDNDFSSGTGSGWNYNIITFDTSHHNEITNCEIVRHEDDETWIYLVDSDSNMISASKCDGYIELRRSGDNSISISNIGYIQLYESSNYNFITDCTLNPGYDGGDSHAFFIWDCDHVYILRCDILSADIGFDILDSTDVEIYGGESSHSEINGAKTWINIGFEDSNSEIKFQDYNLTDYDGTADMTVSYSESYEVDIYWYDLDGITDLGDNEEIDWDPDPDTVGYIDDIDENSDMDYPEEP